MNILFSTEWFVIFSRHVSQILWSAWENSVVLFWFTTKCYLYSIGTSPNKYSVIASYVIFITNIINNPVTWKTTTTICLFKSFHRYIIPRVCAILLFFRILGSVKGNISYFIIIIFGRNASANLSVTNNQIKWCSFTTTF